MENSTNDVFCLLRDPTAFFERIRRGRCDQIGWLAIVSVVCLAGFGFVIGLPHSAWQAFSSAIKMPLLVLGSGLLCLPALYLFSLALGTRLTATQVTTVVLAGICVMALLLLGFAPVVLVFVLTSENYPFLQLLAVGAVAISGCIGLFYLLRGMEQVNLFERASAGLRRAAIGAWFMLYAFVGSQIGWRLSPLVGDPAEPFVWLQPSHGNLYVDVIRALEAAMGLPALAPSAPPAWLGGLCVVPFILLTMGAGLIASSDEA